MAGKITLSNLDSYEEKITAALQELEGGQTVSRIWKHDHTVWAPEPTEISNRLGWLHCVETMTPELDDLGKFVAEVRAAGFESVLLLGMGGSSLAPEVFRKTFGVQPKFLDLAVLDSTDPGAVLAAEQRLDLKKTLFLVSTKSGGTVETFSLFKHFYNRTLALVGPALVGAHFVAITDPKSGLEKQAKELGFRKIFLNDPEIGGRFSALSFFGLVPAALIGVDVRKLLQRSGEMISLCKKEKAEANEGLRLGTIFGELALSGRDKLTLITSPKISNFGAWVEQLVAESSGKAGKGILPVDLEPLGAPSVYGSDRLFVYLRLLGDSAQDAAVNALKENGQPVIEIALQDLYDLGGQFFVWEMATAVACQRLGVNPFDQPNVEAAKVLARDMVAAFQKEGKLPAQRPALSTDKVEIYADIAVDSVDEALSVFFAFAKTGGGQLSYVALQAYVKPTSETDAALQKMRQRIRDKFKLAVTVGYGPRFLHSTGQLHKGDAGKGLFIQFTSEMLADLPIPDQPGQNDTSISFGVLKNAQALGDRKALIDSGRKVICFHLKTDPAAGFAAITANI